MYKYDFGDAPDDLTGDYPTYKVSNGSRHLIGDIWLGSIVDGEADGQPTNQDDVVGADDEDGVVFVGHPWLAGGTGSVQITVSEAQSGIISSQTPAYIHGWIDWNQDGFWDGPNENIFCSYEITAAGTYSISFPVPGDALPGSTWTRFRLDNDTSLNYFKGEANNGEVEDYLVDPAVFGRRVRGDQEFPVGGIMTPANTVTILLPYLTPLFGGVLAVATVIIVKKREKDKSPNN